MKLEQIKLEIDALILKSPLTEQEKIRRRKLVSASRFLSEVCPKLLTVSRQFCDPNATELELDDTAIFIDRTLGIDGIFSNQALGVSTFYASRTHKVIKNLPSGGILLRLARNKVSNNSAGLMMCDLEVWRILASSAILPGTSARPNYHIFSWFVDEGNVEKCVSFCCISDASLTKIVDDLFEDIDGYNEDAIGFFNRLIRGNDGRLRANEAQMDNLRRSLAAHDVKTHKRYDDVPGACNRTSNQFTEFLCLSPQLIQKRCLNNDAVFWKAFDKIIPCIDNNLMHSKYVY